MGEKVAGFKYKTYGPFTEVMFISFAAPQASVPLRIVYNNFFSSQTILSSVNVSTFTFAKKELKIVLSRIIPI